MPFAFRQADAGIINSTGPGRVPPNKAEPYGAYIPGFGAWRDPRLARRFFSKIEALGAGAGLVWQLSLRSIVSNTTRQRLEYDFIVAANATIVKMVNRSAHWRRGGRRAGRRRVGDQLVTPLTQFLRTQPFTK